MNIQESIELGPIHPWLPGMMKMKVGLNGDRMMSAEPEFGYASRGILARVRGQPLEVAQRFFSRLDPEGAFLMDLIFSESAEKAYGTEAPARSKWIRDIAIEMTDVLKTLKFLSTMAKHFGLGMLSHLLRKHREELLDLFERLSGSRFGYFYVIPGGTRYDITDGFLERVEVWSKNYLEDFNRIEALFFWTQSFQNRLDQLGVVLDNGQFGFVSEARVEASRLGWKSSVGSRLRYALVESKNLAESILELSQKNEAGPFFNSDLGTLKNKKTEHDFDTLRGPWSTTIEFEADHKIKNIQIQTPSDLIKKAIPLVLETEAFDDLPLILSSTHFLVMEVDR